MKVLVTGGSRGIGKATVDLFKNKGHEVIAPTRKELDLTEKHIQLENTNFDIIINNAGINILNGITNSTYQKEIMQVNYFSSLSIVQQCLPYMTKQNYGRIINIGSIWINLAKPMRLAYAVSKNALHTLTKMIAVEYSQYNILSNTVSPGYIETDLTLHNRTSDELQQICEKTPLGRLGQPHEIAKTIYHLTVENTFITGQNIIIDGGYSCIAQ